MGPCHLDGNPGDFVGSWSPPRLLPLATLHVLAHADDNRETPVHHPGAVPSSHPVSSPECHWLQGGGVCGENVSKSAVITVE